MLGGVPSVSYELAKPHTSAPERHIPPHTPASALGEYATLASVFVSCLFICKSALRAELRGVARTLRRTILRILGKAIRQGSLKAIQPIPERPHCLGSVASFSS